MFIGKWDLQSRCSNDTMHCVITNLQPLILEPFRPLTYQKSYNSFQKLYNIRQGSPFYFCTVNHFKIRTPPKQFFTGC